MGEEDKSRRSRSAGDGAMRCEEAAPAGEAGFDRLGGVA
jgi:hypothetical protein